MISFINIDYSITLIKLISKTLLIIINYSFLGGNINENKIEKYIVLIGSLILLFFFIWWAFFGGQEWISNQIFE